MRDSIVNNGIHTYTEAEKYVPTDNPLVQAHIDWFMGLKLGFMMHWAPGCQLGTYESWPLSDGDGSWSQEDVNWTDIPTFKEQYINSNKTFNPVKFRPDKWAKLAKDCGFKYLLFTTKHHDGFCMFDTETTGYKITDDSCPFSSNPNADIVRALYNAFRNEGLAISTYFSKPDWHNNDYWHKEFGTSPTRNVNYDIDKYPEMWQRFVDFTHKQIEELGTKYGKIDVLWLDGGWVNPDNNKQDIKLGEIVEKLRSTTQPHLIVCDRCVGGKYENIVTPEKSVPETPLFIPWETCTTIGEKFSFHYTDKFKSGKELVHLLLDVVSKGGNLALNIAPQPDGELPAPAISSIKELGRWLNIHGKGIYETTIISPYFDENLKYTKKDNLTYVFYLYDDEPLLPSSILVKTDKEVSKVTLIRTGKNVPFSQNDNAVTLYTSDIDISTAEFADGFILE